MPTESKRRKNLAGLLSRKERIAAKMAALEAQNIRVDKELRDLSPKVDRTARLEIADTVLAAIDAGGIHLSVVDLETAVLNRLDDDDVDVRKHVHSLLHGEVHEELSRPRTRKVRNLRASSDNSGTDETSADFGGRDDGLTVAKDAVVSAASQGALNSAAESAIADGAKTADVPLSLTPDSSPDQVDGLFDIPIPPGWSRDAFGNPVAPESRGP